MEGGFSVKGGAVLLAVSVVLAGCKSGANSNSGSTQSQTGAIQLSGAGSTFAYPLYSRLGTEYKRLHPDVSVNYQSIGSGGGIRQMIAGTVDFGGTDGPMTDAQLAEAKNTRGTDILHFPVALGADVPTYNIPGVTATLNFTPDALAGIFLGKVTKWNDPAIAAVNPGVNLPNSNILVVHRSDGSGTTYVWTDYLSKISPEWKSKAGVSTSVSWPVGLGAKGNEGVAGMVRQTPGSLGYIELIYGIQNKMTYGAVRNSAGKFVRADISSVTDAAAGAVANMPADFRVSITDAPGESSYPVSSFTWMLVPKSMADKTKGSALKAFLTWTLTDGQKLTRPLSYAPVAAPVIAKEMQAMGQLQY